MTNRGWIKLWRKSVDSELWGDINAWRVFETLLFMADPFGKINTTIRDISEQSKIPQTTCYRCLYRLERNDIANVKRNNRETLISICKWDNYQSIPERKAERKAEQSSRQQVHELNLKRNDDPESKNNKKIKKRDNFEKRDAFSKNRQENDDWNYKIK